MTKEQFITASKNVAKYYYGVNLPITEDSLVKKEGSNYYFYFEQASTYDDNDDNEVDCVFWYTVSDFTDDDTGCVIELARGLEGHIRGDHCLVKVNDWLSTPPVKQ